MEQEESSRDSFLTRSISGIYCYIILDSDDLFLWKGEENRKETGIIFTGM